MSDETQPLANPLVKTADPDSDDKKRDGEKPPSTDAAKTLFDSTQKWFWDAGNVLIRGMAFYLALMAVTVGYVLTTELTPPLINLVLSLALVTSILFVAAWTGCVEVMYRCIEVLEKLRNHLLKDPALGALGLENVFLESRQFVKIITRIVFGFVIAIIGAIIVLWDQLPINK